MRIGIVGCGSISGIYFENLAKFPETEVFACADLDLERAKAAAAKYGVRAVTTDELVTHPDVDLVLNLTIPKAHAEIGIKALDADKHLYNEKPLAISREDGRLMLDIAKEKGLRLGCAPDTFLGGGIQTCRQLIEEGAVGSPVAAQAFMLCHGHEGWHPSPEFYYEKGGGPMFDMGPYYLTALIHLMGPIRRVTGSARITFPTRTITSEPKKGATIHVETPTHIAGVIDFASGAVGEITTSFDVWHSKLPPITIHGTEGSMLVGDPNSFGDRVHIRRSSDAEWTEMPHTHGYTENSRGLGVRDIALAIREDRAHKASGDLAFHVLDAMHAFHEASEQGKHIELVERQGFVFRR